MNAGQWQNLQQRIADNSGVDKTMEPGDVQHLLDAHWQYGQPAPEGYYYGASGLLTHQPHTGRDFGKGAAVAGSIGLAVATMGATSPYTAALLGAGSGALAGGAQGGVKGALIGAGLGAAGGALAPSLQSANLGTRAGVQAGLGAAQGAAQGGTRGALLGAAGGAGGAAIGGAGQALSNSGASLTQQALTRAALQGGLNYGLSGGNPYAALTGAAQGGLTNPYQVRR